MPRSYGHPKGILPALCLALAALWAAALPGHVHAAAPSAAVQPQEPRRPAGVDIRVTERGWGSARTQDIEAVLYSVASVLIEHFPGRRLNPIRVSHSPERPITLYRKGPGNAYLVQLSASGEHWARYAYEFAHEFSHILMNYDHHADIETASFNQWFEEALCEAASLYALKRLAFEWEVRPPQPQFASYAPEFERYVERFLGESHRRLPPGVTLAAWFREHEETLRGRAYDRDQNEVVAMALLPLFEENEALWEAIGYLNLDPRRSTFRGYLQRWHDQAPDDYKDTIRYIMGLFGVLGGNGVEAAGDDTSERAPALPGPPGVAGPAARGQK